jgi:putative tryptophan/tyrosine transport system substrate-binding protein
VIQRRTFLAATGAAIFTAPLVGETQSSGNLPRVGVLSSGFASHSAVGGQFAYVYLAIREGLRENGYVDGQNLTIEYRFAEGRIDRLVGLAGELVSLNVNVILALGVVVLRAVKNVTATVPIVVIDLETDPVSAGSNGRRSSTSS